MPCMMMMGNSLGSSWAQVNFIMRNTMNEKAGRRRQKGNSRKGGQAWTGRRFDGVRAHMKGVGESGIEAKGSRLRDYIERSV